MRVSDVKEITNVIKNIGISRVSAWVEGFVNLLKLFNYASVLNAYVRLDDGVFLQPDLFI